MRTKNLRWKRRALGVAVAVSWVSSTQLVGCLNNSARTDLATEAGRAALQADDDESSQKRSPAAASSSRSLPGNVVIAGGDIPEDDSPILRTSGENPAQKSSIWSIFGQKPAQPAVKDPFADLPEPGARPDEKVVQSGPAVAPGKMQLKPGTSEEAGTEKSAPRFTPENWFEKDLARNAPLSNWEREAVSQSNAAALKADQPAVNLNVGSKLADADQNPKSLKTGTQSRLNSYPEIWEAQQTSTTKTVPSGEAAVIKMAPASTANEWQSSDSAGSPQRALSRPREDNPFDRMERKLASSRDKEIADSPAVRQQKLRIQALLSESHTSVVKGELHAAYRSALLAEKIAKEHQISFTENEENPTDLARNIASSIWRTSNASEEAYFASAEAAREVAPAAAAGADTDKSVMLTSAAPVSPLGARHESPFMDDAFATWKPLPESIDSRPNRKQQDAVASTFRPDPAPHIQQSLPSAQSQRAPAASSPFDVLPEIRPGAVAKSSVAKSFPENSGMTSGEPALVAASPDGRPLAALSQDHAPEAVKRSVDSGVHFAIAQSVDGEGSLQDPFAAGGQMLHKDSATAVDPDQTLAATFGQNRPKLLAPPIPVAGSAVASEQLQMTWEEASRSPAAPVTAEAPKIAQASSWRVMWSIIGLFAAAIAAVIGFRVSRVKEEASQQLTANSQDPTVVAASIAPAHTESQLDSRSDPEIQAIQFKRAA